MHCNEMIHYSQEDLVAIEFKDQGPSIRKTFKRGFSLGPTIKNEKGQDKMDRKSGI